MARVQTKLTETACKNAQPDTKLWDSEIKGFALFVGKTRKTFYFQKDIGGKTTRTKLGTWPDTRTADARYEASLHVAEHASGAVAKRLREARVPTLSDALETYLARPKLRSELNKKLVRNQIEGHWTCRGLMPLL